MLDQDRPLPPGKLPAPILDRLISRYVKPDPSVLIGPGIGRDAAAIAIGEHAIVVKTDPITFATADAGRYVVNVNANDIACMGAVPRWLLVTALLPERSTTVQLVEELFASLANAAGELDIALVGGHSEITLGLDRPILVGQMIGEADPADLLDLRAAQPDDAVILSGGIAIEGTAILAREARDCLERLPDSLLDAAADLLRDPGISVVPAARALLNASITVRGLHDPTEGGLATAVHELSEATRLGVEVDANAIPVLPETAAVCDELDLDPLGLIASGALLAVVAAADCDRALAALQEAGISAGYIGRMLEQGDETHLVRGGIREPMPRFEVDEIARFFAAEE